MPSRFRLWIRRSCIPSKRDVRFWIRSQPSCASFSSKQMLFHISEESDIARFEPRASEYATGLVVWAIDETRLCNYLLPRECPRVTYYAGA